MNNWHREVILNSGSWILYFIGIINRQEKTFFAGIFYRYACLDLPIYFCRKNIE